MNLTCLNEEHAKTTGHYYDIISCFNLSVIVLQVSAGQVHETSIKAKPALAFKWVWPI